MKLKLNFFNSVSTPLNDIICSKITENLINSHVFQEFSVKTSGSSARVASGGDDKVLKDH